jgi:spore maturation protein CgeB
MKNSKRIFLISDFNLHDPSGIREERRRWIKGLIRQGHDVQIFSYRDVMHSSSLFHKKSLVKLFNKNKTDRLMIEMIKNYDPEVVFILTMKDLNQESINGIKEAAPNAVFVGRDVDWLPDRNKERIEIAKNMDILAVTNAGTWMEFYKSINVPLCAFIPCPCDPDLQRPYEKNTSSPPDIIFLGKHQYRDNIECVDKDRAAILSKLAKMKNARLFDAHGNRKVHGIQAFREISNSKIALSINAVNNVRMYHSDRLVNCISCGTFTLAKRVPDTDLLFKDGVHLKYFNNPEEFFELAEWYLKHDEQRAKIAHAGMEHAHKEFNCTKLAGYVMDLVETGDYDAPWKYILG